jgi:hypothetical protein
LKAVLQRSDVLRTLRETEQIAPVHGLTQPELTVLAAVAGSVILPDEVMSVYNAKTEVERAGFTALGFSLGIRRLQAKRFLDIQEVIEEGGTYNAIRVMTAGWDWIDQNTDKFLLKKPDPDVPF